MTRERSSFRRNSLHHASIPAHCVNALVEYIEAGPIVPASQPFLRNSHTNAGGDTLAERPAGRLHSGNPVIFWMARRLAVQLPEPLDIIQRNRGLPQPFVLSVDRFRF